VAPKYPAYRIHGSPIVYVVPDLSESLRVLRTLEVQRIGVNCWAELENALRFTHRRAEGAAILGCGITRSRLKLFVCHGISNDLRSLPMVLGWAAPDMSLSRVAQDDPWDFIRDVISVITSKMKQLVQYV
jgi:hypothetical protein